MNMFKITDWVMQNPKKAFAIHLSVGITITLVMITAACLIVKAVFF